MAERLSDEEQAEIDAMHRIVEKGTFYELLGIEGEADAAEVQAAYYELSRRWHPDRYFRRDMGDYGPKLDIVFATITRAYKTLSDGTRRKEYDKAHPRKKTPGLSESASVIERVVRRSTETAAGKSGRSAEQIRQKAKSFKPSRMSKAARLAQRERAKKKAKKQLRAQATARKAKAAEYYAAATELYKEGEMSKAANQYALAAEYDPKNNEYRLRAHEVKKLAREARVKYLLDEGGSQMQFGNVRKALVLYKKAAEMGAEDASLFHQLAGLVTKFEKDERAALAYHRRAVDAAPRNIEYRLALADMYVELKMKMNARREYQAVLAQDKKNKDAKKGLRKVMF